MSATIVTYNSERYIVRCLESLVAQTHRCCEVILVDNHSTDSTCALASSYPEVKVIHNPDNKGYCFAQNQALEASRGDWVLCLNPDTILDPGCVENLVRAGELHPAIGIVCPKILRMSPEGVFSDPPVIDSAGVYMTPSLRHFDRGSESIDYGQFDQPEYVFGYTGAIVLFRRAMIESAKIEGHLLDNDFFYYREDADLSWRTKLLGWRCLYMPSAIGHHVRTVLPTNRKKLPALINLHSTKNRFLMRINNMDSAVYRRVWLAATIRDLAILAYVVLFERTSLPGLIWVLKSWRRLWLKRRLVQAKAVRSAPPLKYWFSRNPEEFPLEPHLYNAFKAPASDPPTHCASPAGASNDA